MSLGFADRILDTSVTAGTGTYTLAGAVDSYFPFSVLADGTEVSYFVEMTGSDDCEVAKGVIGAGGTTLTRATIIASSNGGAAVNWAAGTKRIGLSLLASDADPKGRWYEISRATAAADATISFTGFDPTLYDDYQVEFVNVRPDTFEDQLFMRTSTDGGSNYDSGASDYPLTVTYDGGSGFVISKRPAAGAEIYLNWTIMQKTTNTPMNGRLEIFNPAAAAYCAVQWDITYDDANQPGVWWRAQGAAWRAAAADVNAIQFQFYNSNIATGTFIFRGRRK